VAKLASRARSLGYVVVKITDLAAGWRKVKTLAWREANRDLGSLITVAATFKASAFAIVQRMRSAVALSGATEGQSFSALAQASKRSTTSS
jgi:hypothetical protein